MTHLGLGGLSKLLGSNSYMCAVNVRSEQSDV